MYTKREIKMPNSHKIYQNDNKNTNDLEIGRYI
jgi:hypothetical protein